MNIAALPLNKKTTPTETGDAEKNNFNRNILYQSTTVKEIYTHILATTRGSITILNDDIDGKLLNAISALNPNDAQFKIMQKFHEALKCIEQTIDPNRLRFTISKATDDEIYYYRKSTNGIVKIIIHDDGLIAFSFIAFKDSPKKDVLTFYDNNEAKIDYERLAYDFLSA